MTVFYAKNKNDLKVWQYMRELYILLTFICREKKLIKFDELIHFFEHFEIEINILFLIVLNFIFIEYFI